MILIKSLLIKKIYNDIFDHNFYEVKISLRQQFHYEVISFDVNQISLCNKKKIFFITLPPQFLHIVVEQLSA